MNSYKEIQAMHTEMREWRQHFHQYPETAFDEFNTSQFISSKLKSFELQVHEGLAKTGVVASLTAGTSTGSSEGDCLLHNPHYDFNDKILTVGANYWVKLVNTFAKM